MTRIYLVRHAEAEGNLYRIVQGQANSNLTNRGWRQVEALSKRFADIHIDEVYTSDLYRTCATASAVYKPKGLTPHRRTDLREIYVGSWEGRTWGDIARLWPEQMKHFSRRPDLWHLEDAEQPMEVLARTETALHAIAAENEGKTVAVFSHGYAIRLLLAKLQGYPPERMGESPTGQNTAVSLLEWEEGELRVIFRDDISHLQTEEFLAGEKVRRKADPLEPGLWFKAPEGSEAEEIAKRCGVSIHPEATTLIGWSRETAVGVVQLGLEPGHISLVCIHPDHRTKGFGGQLIGQAVQWARTQGETALYAALEEGSSAEPFFRDYGFVPQDSDDRGKRIFVKDISFRPEFLSDTI